MGEEHYHNQQNQREISLGWLRRGGTHNPIRVDIAACVTCDTWGAFSGVEKMIRETFLRRIFFGNKKNLSPIVGALSIIPINMAVMGLLSPVTSAKDNYLSYQWGSIEIIQAVIGGGSFSNADHLRTLGE